MEGVSLTHYKDVVKLLVMTTACISGVFTQRVKLMVAGLCSVFIH